MLGFVIGGGLTKIIVLRRIRPKASWTELPPDVVTGSCGRTLRLCRFGHRIRSNNRRHVKLFSVHRIA
jgi:hypothetical protein